ncbi:hypothetical protein ZEAMMB73_Zm00001d052419 [Zea mays]|uniref:Uncharacterized protein n=1 Tax=Zea mays TaxID=4577 RepID=A0A1D6QH12_MAIZE|nr:hypothetical protein ZEAMMB73_Zm00001d052419 [Zea mays]
MKKCFYLCYLLIGGVLCTFHPTSHRCPRLLHLTILCDQIHKRHPWVRSLLQLSCYQDFFSMVPLCLSTVCYCLIGMHHDSRVEFA